MYVERKGVRGARIGAAIIDMIIVFFISSIVRLIMSTAIFFNGVASRTVYQSFTLYNFLLMLVFYFLYHTFIPYLAKGKTLGKMMVGIKVISNDFNKAKFYQYFLRNIFLFETLILSGYQVFISYSRGYSFYNPIGLFGSSLVGLLSILINLIIMIMILTTEEERGFHDLIAGTLVVSKDFDLDKLNRVNVLERQNMDWAIFDDDTVQKDSNQSENVHIQILEDEIELLKQDDE